MSAASVQWLEPMRYSGARYHSVVIWHVLSDAPPRIFAAPCGDNGVTSYLKFTKLIPEEHSRARRRTKSQIFTVGASFVPEMSILAGFKSCEADRVRVDTSSYGRNVASCACSGTHSVRDVQLVQLHEAFQQLLRAAAHVRYKF